jgi:CHASE2 domain-containing sensor protein
MDSSDSGRHLNKVVIAHSLLLAFLLPLFVLVLLLLVQEGFYEDLSYSRFLDLGYQSRGLRTANNSIVLINIEQLPVSRTRLAAGIEIVKQCLPRAIGLDIVLDRMYQSKEDTLLSNSLRGGVPMVVACELDADKVVPPSRFFQHENVSLGYSELMVGRDGVVRRFRSSREVRGRQCPAFAVQIARVAGAVVDMEAPSGRDYLINYAGDEQSFNTIRLTEILQQKPENVKALLKGKMIVFGYFADDSTRYPIFTDLHTTPLSSNLTRFPQGRMYGSVIHANILDTVVGNRRIIEIGRYCGLGICFSIIFVNLLVKSVLIQKAGRLRTILFWGVIALEFIVLASLPFLLFFYHDIQIDLSIPLIALLVFPRAEPWYYRFVDNLGIPVRRMTLRRLPIFLTRPYLEVYRASSLQQRVSAALHLSRILHPLVDFLMTSLRKANGSEAILKEIGAQLDRLERSSRSLKEILFRANALLVIEERFHQVKIEFALGEEWNAQQGAGGRDSIAEISGLDRCSVGLAFPSVTLANGDAGNETFFLELLSAINRVLHALRRVSADMRWEEFVSNAEIAEKRSRSIMRNGTAQLDAHVALVPKIGRRIDLFPYVLERQCLIHRQLELFAFTKEWGSDGLLGLSADYRGPTAGCFFAETPPESSGSLNLQHFEKA